MRSVRGDLLGDAHPGKEVTAGSMTLSFDGSSAVHGEPHSTWGRRMYRQPYWTSVTMAFLSVTSS